MNKNEVVSAIEKLECKYTNEGNIVNNKNSKVANFIIVPQRQIRVEQYGSYDIYVEFSAIIMGDKEVPNIKLPASDVGNLKWVEFKLGLHATVYKKNEFLLIIKSLFGDVKVSEQCSHTGWAKI